MFCTLSDATPVHLFQHRAVRCAGGGALRVAWWKVLVRFVVPRCLGNLVAHFFARFVTLLVYQKHTVMRIIQKETGARKGRTL